MKRPAASETKPATRALAIGSVRAVVGLVMLLAPKAVARLGPDDEPTGSLALLMRTIGVRDLALGIGTIAAARSAGDDETFRWIAMGLFSDALDATTGAASVPLIGRRGALIATGIPLPVIVGDLWALAGFRSRRAEPVD